MRFMSLCLPVLAAAAPLPAQELGFFGTSAIQRTEETAAHGAGIFLAGSFRLGSIMADSNVLRRSNVRIGARIAVSEVYWNALDYRRCIDDCPPGAHDIRIELRTTHGSLFLFPYRTPSTRLELGAGVAAYAHRGDVRGNSWGFSAGAAFARRLRPNAPLWLNAGYERHGRSLMPEMADDRRWDPPPHSIRLGLSYHVSDR